MPHMGNLSQDQKIEFFRNLPARSWDVHTESGNIEILPMSKDHLKQYAGLFDPLAKDYKGAWFINDGKGIATNGKFWDSIFGGLPTSVHTSDFKTQEWYLNQALDKGTKVRLTKIDAEGKEVDHMTTRIKGITAH